MADAAVDTLAAAKEGVRETRQQNTLLWWTLGLSFVASIAGAISAWAAHTGITKLERPYLVAESTTATKTGNTIQVGIRVKNYGRSPGVVRLLSLGGVKARSPSQGLFNAIYSVNLRDQSIAIPDIDTPFATIRGVNIVDCAGVLLNDASFPTETYVYGRVQYDTTLGHRYERYFCWQFFGRDEFKEVGGQLLNGERRVSTWGNRFGYYLGYLSGRYLPDPMNERVRAFMAKKAAAETKRNDRAYPRR